MKFRPKSSRTFIRGCTSMRNPSPALGSTPSIFPGVGPMNPQPPHATNPKWLNIFFSRLLRSLLNICLYSTRAM